MMTMDIHQRCMESGTFLGSRGDAASPGSEPSSTPPSITSVPAVKAPAKRSFDVAFLMAPDDSTKKRQHQELKEQLRFVAATNLVNRYSPPSVVCSDRDTGTAKLSSPGALPYPEAPIGLLMPSNRHFKEEMDKLVVQGEMGKSAFTKVVQPPRIDLSVIPPNPTSPSSVSSTMSGGTVSPDMSYQDSLSPPPLKTRTQYPPPPAKFYNGKPSFNYHTPKPTARHPDEPAVYIKKSPSDEKNKKNVIYPGDVMTGPPYPGIPVAGYPFPGSFGLGPVGTATLIPPTLAALTPLTQNVCAKCNVSFRMTSDLVYHMRSQHKNDSTQTESARRRREQEKLRCPVCNESFRERHHLTRHMTAHQDKDGDSGEEEEEGSGRRRTK